MTIAKVLLRPAAPAAIALTMGAHLPVDQAQGQGIGPEVFGELVEACSMDRKPLETRIITQSVYDGANVEWVEGGWVALEEGTGDLLLFNDAAELAERWGRTHSGLEGPPLILGGARVGRLEQTGLVFMDKQGAYPVFGQPDHAIANEQGQVVYTAAGSILVMDLESRETGTMLRPADFGIDVDEKTGLPPKGLLRMDSAGRLHVAWRAQSSLWRLEENGAPVLLFQRCVPEVLKQTHRLAPHVDLSHMGMPDSVSVSISSISDFVVLESGDILVLGELRVGSAAHRSLELYGEDGSLKNAWELPIPMAIGRLDPFNPGQMLLWRRWVDGEPDHSLVLVELAGEGYPP